MDSLENTILRVPSIFFQREVLKIIGKSQGFDLEGSVELFVCTSCS